MSTALSELTIGQEITDFFVCANKIAKVDRNDRKFLDLRLANANGKIIAKMWDVSDETIESFDNHDIVKVQAVVNPGFQGGDHELKVKQIRRANAEDEIDMTALLAASPRDLEEMRAELATVRASIYNRDLAALLDSIFDDDTRYRSFCEAPAAKGVHHNYLHGLLEHTVAVCEISSAIADQYPEINRDLLVTGAILHDIGKIDEFNYSTAIDYSDRGRLLGHIVLGERIVTAAISKLDSFPGELELQLLHLILAHHGELEYGSPQPAQTLEAFVLHHADNIDAKANVFARKRADTDDDWSGYDRVFNRFFYLKKAEE